MLTNLLLPPFRLLSIYYTFYTLLQNIHNLFLLLLCTVLTMFLQVAIVDQILPYNSQFKLTIEVQDLDTQSRRHDNSHYWLQQDILQIKKLSILILSQYHP